LPTQAKPLVLIADPVDTTRALLTQVFQDELGWRVAAVGDGSALLVGIHEVVIDLIVLELDSRRGTDLDLVQDLQRNPLTVDIPLLCMTAWGTQLTPDEAIAAGAEVCLPKPFDLETLIGEAKRLVDERAGGSARA
jgi:CheY-like chemotaxis protein